jgi:hypothetical protein
MARLSIDAKWEVSEARGGRLLPSPALGAKRKTRIKGKDDLLDGSRSKVVWLFHAPTFFLHEIGASFSISAVRRSLADDDLRYSLLLVVRDATQEEHPRRTCGPRRKRVLSLVRDVGHEVAL